MRYLFLFSLFCATAVLATAQKGPFCLLSYNIRNGKGMDGKTDYDRTAALLNNVNADIIALQELDSATRRSGGAVVLKELAKRTGMRDVFGAAISYDGGRYGVGLLSKERPVGHRTIALPGREEARVLLLVEFKRYVVVVTHLSLTPADRLASLPLIEEAVGHYRKPVYLLGDLNAEPGDPFITGLQQRWQLLSGTAPTFPADKPVKCIDYIFSRNSKRTVKSARVLEDGMTSDHRAVEVRM